MNTTTKGYIAPSNAQNALYKRQSCISYIIDYTNQVDAYSEGCLNKDIEAEQQLLTQIKRNTNSIKTLVYKYLDKLQKQSFNL